MQVDLNALANSYEVEPVSIGNPFKSLIVDPSTMEVLRFIPIIAFIALIFAAVYRQGKKFPIKAMGDLKEENKQAWNQSKRISDISMLLMFWFFIILNGTIEMSFYKIYYIPYIINFSERSKRID